MSRRRRGYTEGPGPLRLEGWGTLQKHCLASVWPSGIFFFFFLSGSALFFSRAGAKINQIPLKGKTIIVLTLLLLCLPYFIFPAHITLQGSYLLFIKVGIHQKPGLWGESQCAFSVCWYYLYGELCLTLTSCSILYFHVKRLLILVFRVFNIYNITIHLIIFSIG